MSDLVTRVVNVRRYNGMHGDVIYIGRKPTGVHYGNPFSHLPDTLATIHVESREESIVQYERWLKREAHLDLEPERREWILSMLPFIKGYALGCYCAPSSCHGDVLARMAEDSR